MTHKEQTDIDKSLLVVAVKFEVAGPEAGPYLHPIRPCLVKTWGPHINLLTLKRPCCCYNFVKLHYITNVQKLL